MHSAVAAPFLQSLKVSMRKVIVSIYLLLLWGCSEGQGPKWVAEDEEKHFHRAQQKLKEGNNKEALQAFLKVIDKRKAAPESHLEVGRLYLRHFNDPVESIHHFRKYLEYKPDSPYTDQVNALIDTARKEFARELPGQPFQDELDRLDLMELLKQVQEENVGLRRKLLTAQETIENLEKAIQVPIAGSSSQSIVSDDRTETVLTVPDQEDATTSSGTQTPTSSKTYTVQSGDSLTKISTRIYGDPNRWKDIYNANRDQLPNEHELKIGQVLRLP